LTAGGSPPSPMSWTRAAHTALPESLLAAVNMEYARPDQPVRDGDEVAFFPPVTGGAL